MNDGEQVLDHFLFRAESFLIEHQQCTVMGVAQVREEFVPEPSQSILVGDYQRCDLTRNDGINQRKEFRTGEVQPAADLGNPFVYRESPCSAEHLKRTALILLSTL